MRKRERERETDLSSAFFKKLVNNIIIRRCTKPPFGVLLPFSMQVGTIFVVIHLTP